MAVITLDGPDRASILEQVTEGTVIFTAHGVSPLVKQRAAERGLHVIDATCPDVTKTHDLVRALVAQGYQILYIGKKGHPEPEGVIGEAPDHVYLVETEADLDTLPAAFVAAEKLAVTTQTTLSQWDTATPDPQPSRHAIPRRRSTTRSARRRRCGRRRWPTWRAAPT